MSEVDKLLRDIFGDSLNRMSEFQSEQVRKLTSKLQELAREGVREDIVRLSNEIIDLKTRVAALEAERVRHAAEDVEPY